jgi:hypothetical protein
MFQRGTRRIFACSQNNFLVSDAQHMVRERCCSMKFLIFKNLVNIFFKNLIIQSNEMLKKIV